MRQILFSTTLGAALTLFPVNFTDGGGSLASIHPPKIRALARAVPQNLCVEPELSLYIECHNKALQTFYQDSGLCSSLPTFQAQEDCRSRARFKKGLATVECESRFPRCAGLYTQP